MKKICVTFLLSGLIATVEAQHSLTKLWASDTSLAVPESVLYDEDEKVLWVSCINGKPTDPDGKGSIAQLRHDGRIIDPEWVKGLNAPKGMARNGKYLYVSDITELVVIDIPNRKVEKKIPVEGARFLNDVTVDPEGVVYVSDMETGKVHAFKNDMPFTYLENLPGVNGIKFVDGALYAVAVGALYRKNLKGLEKLAEGMDKSTDGLERVAKGEFVVSCWSGVVYYVTTKGTVSQMLDTRQKGSQTADIGFSQSTRTVFVPTFFRNGVVAYTLK